MFEKFVEDIRNMPVVPPILVDMDISNDPNYSMETFKTMVLHNSDMNDGDLYTFLKQNYAEVLKMIFEMHNPMYLQYFTSPKFLNTLTAVLHQVPIDDNIRTYCNKLVYDYITFKDMKRDIADMMIGLSKAVNKDIILVLRGLDLSEEHAVYLALASRSAQVDTINIRRVNFIIATSVSERWENLDDEDAMAEAQQLIIYIYQKLFNMITILFESTMFDVYDTSAEWMTDRISIMYSLTSSAVLLILNSFPLNDIKTVLRAYSLDYGVLVQNGKRPRFSLLSLSEDYSRINSAIEMLKTEGIYVR